jgi:hypothetical protein
LRFFDDSPGTAILHQDRSRPFPIGIEFEDSSSYAGYIFGTHWTERGYGTYTSREIRNVSEPEMITLMAALIGFFVCIQNASICTNQFDSDQFCSKRAKSKVETVHLLNDNYSHHLLMTLQLCSQFTRFLSGFFL